MSFSTAMNCPRCKSENVGRVRRRNVWDNFRAFLGGWPYGCDDCELRFTAASRYGPDRRTASVTQPSDPETSRRGGPEMAYRNDPIRPVAKIVIQADDQVQLENILRALDRAVSYYQKPKREHTTAR
jgi:hypothetical protein